MPLLDNLERPSSRSACCPSTGAGGIGAALLALLEEWPGARPHPFDAMAAWPYDGPDGAGTSGRRVRQAHGYVFGLA